jgi:hypothetical protein
MMITTAIRIHFIFYRVHAQRNAATPSPRPSGLPSSTDNYNRIQLKMSDDSQTTEAAPQRPKAPANIMPGGTAHTAGGQKHEDEPSYIDVVRNLGPEYYLNFHKRPCVRDSQLTGIGAGFVGGSIAAIARSMFSSIPFAILFNVMGTEYHATILITSVKQDQYAPAPTSPS